MRITDTDVDNVGFGQIFDLLRTMAEGFGTPRSQARTSAPGPDFAIDCERDRDLVASLDLDNVHALESFDNLRSVVSGCVTMAKFSVISSSKRPDCLAI